MDKDQKRILELERLLLDSYRNDYTTARQRTRGSQRHSKDTNHTIVLLLLVILAFSLIV